MSRVLLQVGNKVKIPAAYDVYMVDMGTENKLPNRAIQGMPEVGRIMYEGKERKYYKLAIRLPFDAEIVDEDEDLNGYFMKTNDSTILYMKKAKIDNGIIVQSGSSHRRKRRSTKRAKRSKRRSRKN